jgi:uncharacterized protein YfaS (alpha-2-macroglobulin family)
LKFSPLWLFILLFLLLPSVFSHPQLEITVYTNKSLYGRGEKVEIYGEVMLDGVPLENIMVALEVRDPLANSIITRTVETNSSGVYTLSFSLDSESLLGTYTVHVSCSHDGENASNSSSFDVEHIPSLILIVKTSNETYKPGETIVIFGNVTYDNSPVQGILVAVEVQDPEGTPIVIRVLETGQQGNYELTLQLTSESKRGEYSVHASANHEGKQTMASTTFQLEIELITDINGDGVVNIVDLYMAAQAWGTSPGDPKWNPKCDLDGNGVINIIDLYLVARDFGKKI